MIDAVYSLVAEGKIPPGVDDVAERAGISVSSVFRNFDGLADLQRRALEEFHPRFAHLFAVEDADAPRAERIRSHVRARVELIGVASGLLRIARSRALDHETLVEGSPTCVINSLPKQRNDSLPISINSLQSRQQICWQLSMPQLHPKPSM